jgi:hypothetical protein
MKFKNNVFADILVGEVMAYCYSYGEMEQMCVKKYENDDELVEVLEFISKLVNPNNHREALCALFSVAHEFKSQISYNLYGVARLSVEHIVGSDYDRFIDRLNDEFSKNGIDGDVSIEVHEIIDNGTVIARI